MKFRFTIAILASLVLTVIVGAIVGSWGVLGCAFGNMYIPVPCRLLNFTILALLTAIIIDVVIDVIWPNIKKRYSTKKDIKPKEDQPKIRHQKFSWRAHHAEYRVSANSEIVHKYLLQNLTGIAWFTTENKGVVYVTSGVTLIDPNNSDETFQYGLIVSGRKETGTKSKPFLGGKNSTTTIRSLTGIEPVLEMFFVSVSQGAENVSLVSFDTDFRDVATFSKGLLRDLKKGFTVKVIRDINGKESK